MKKFIMVNIGSKTACYKMNMAKIGELCIENEIHYRKWIFTTRIALVNCAYYQTNMKFQQFS